MSNSRRIKVAANGKRGKQLITQHGDEWIHIHTIDMPCFNGGLGMLIESLDGKHRRNIKLLVDDVFSYRFIMSEA